MESSTVSLPFQADDTLDDLLALVRKKYDVTFVPVKIGDIELELVEIADMAAHIDRLAAQAGSDAVLELPLWARVWPASLILAHFLARLTPGEGHSSLLELGAGVGLCGLVAARRGFRSVISDINPDSLLFCRINTLRNNLADTAEIRYVDFTDSRLGERFEVIVGSELLYRDEFYRPLEKFLGAHLSLRPEAQILIAEDHRRKADKFFKLAEREYHIDTKIIGYKSKPAEGETAEKSLCKIHRFKARKHA